MNDSPPIKILVGYHKPAFLLKSDVLVPIHLGRSIAMEPSKDGVLSHCDHNWMLQQMNGDDTGENISAKNRMYAELTGIYWAWKNYESLGNPDYIGFMHYRRIFDFKNESINYPINKILNLRQVKCYSKQQGIWDTEFIKTFIREHEYVVSLHHKGNPLAHFARSRWCRTEDLQLAVDAIKSTCPEFLPSAEKYLSCNEIIFCNMFILPKASFFQYAEFIFKLLFGIETKIDLNDTNYPVERQRALAMLAEQLTGIFFTYLRTQHNVTELPLIYAEHPEIDDEKELCFQEEGVVPIVFSTDEKYYLYVEVAIQSIIENKRDVTKYAIIIMETGLTSFQIEKLEMLSRRNVQIFVLDVTEICKTYRVNRLMVINHLSTTAYIRLLVCEILKKYHKVIYLDCDLIVLTDLSEIYHDTDLSHKYAAVVRDYLVGTVFSKRAEFVKYMKHVLHIDDLALYFNSGVMILNLDLMRKDNIQDRLLEVASVNNKYFHDQNVLNSVLYKKVVYLKGAYNVNYFLYFDNHRSEMPKSYFEEFRNPKILHFASGNKPWKRPELPAANLFWHYARLTPIYEEIIFANLIKSAVDATNISANMSVYRDILKSAINYRRLRLKLFYYRFLSGVTFGERRKKILQKKVMLKKELRTVREFLK